MIKTKVGSRWIARECHCPLGRMRSPARYGPATWQRDASKGKGLAPAKECPECQSVIPAGYARCPDCGYEFPPPERGKHDAKASEAGILSGQVTTTKHTVEDAFFSVHKKRGAGDDAPRSMRVDYKLSWNKFQSEWVCFEHDGYARQKAIAWWKRRSPDPGPLRLDGLRLRSRLRGRYGSSANP